MDWNRADCLPAPETAPMQQHPAYGRSCAALGGRMLHYLASGPDGPVATAQVLVRRWPLFGDFALVARGPAWIVPPSPGLSRIALTRLVHQLRRELCGVIVTPDCLDCDPLQRAGMLPIMSPGMLAALPLGGQPHDRLARQHGKWRNRLRRAQDAGLTVTARPLPETGDHWLLRLEAEQAQKRRYRRLPTDFTRAWRRVNGPGSITILTAEKTGRPIAAMLFLHHGRVASYHIGWSGPEGRDLNAHNLLLWEASERFAAEGCTRIDLGTLDTETTPGLARFKLGSGAVPVRLGSSWMDAPGARAVARLIGTDPPPPRVQPELAA